MSRKTPLKHENLYLSEESKARLEHLKVIDKKIIKNIRRAVEAEIEREWKKLCEMSDEGYPGPHP
jgi:hypothetical protein